MQLLRVTGFPRLRDEVAPGRGRALPQLPLLRQPPEVPAVRQHLLGEGGGGAPRRHGARPPSSRAAGGEAVRRRHGRRHGADPGHARDAPAPADAAVLRRRQGDQPGGCAPLPRQDGRPLPRAPRDRAGRHQHVLHRGAVADAEGASAATSLVWHEVGAHRQYGGRVQRADRGARAVPRQGLAGPPFAQDRQSRSTSGRSRSSSTATTTASCSTT